MFWKKKKVQVGEKPDSQISKPIELKSSSKKADLYVVEEVKANEEKVKIQKYHVSQNKDKDAEYYMKWRVRKESSDKTIQYFDTQKLAIDFAQDLANKFGTTVVIHKLDGSIRKQDYTNK